MIKNSYILSEGGWGIKSSEIFADIFYCLSLLAVLSIFTVYQPQVFALAAGELLVLLGIFYLYSFKSKQGVYSLAILSQFLLCLLIVPIPFLHPLLILLSIIFGSLLYFLLKRKFSLQIALVCYFLFCFFVFDFFFTLAGFPLRVSGQSSLYFPILEQVQAKTLGPAFSRALLVDQSFEVETFRGCFEYLSTYILIGISWVAFRRPILLTYFFGWVLLFFSFNYFQANLPPGWIISFSGMAFLLHFAPGRNFYGSFYVTLLSFMIVLPMAWLVGKLGGQAILMIFLFFPVEALLARVFLGK